MNDMILIIDNLTTLFSHNDIIYLQIGIGFVRNLDRGSRVCMKFSRADEFIGCYIDITAAGSDVRNLHKIDRKAGVISRNIPIIIHHQQIQVFHLILDSVALSNIGRHFCCVAVIGGNQFVQFLVPGAQGVGIVKGSLGNAVLYPQVSLIVVRLDGQPSCYGAPDGHINGSSCACNEGTSHVDNTRFRHGLFRHNRIRGQELLVDFFTAVHPCPLALVRNY